MSVAYIPKQFSFDGLIKQHDFIEKHNFGQLIVAKTRTLNVAHLPFFLDRNFKPKGRLLCHVATSNPIWEDIHSANVVAVFSGPHAYISPKWYVTNDQVPTWNNSAIYAHVTAKIIEQPDLGKHLSQLVEREEKLMSPDKPWSVEEISSATYESMQKYIIGIELSISSIEAKMKMSQNRNPEDRMGVVEQLEVIGSEQTRSVASMIKSEFK